MLAAPDIVIAGGAILQGIVAIGAIAGRLGRPPEDQARDDDAGHDQHMEDDELAVPDPRAGAQAENVGPHDAEKQHELESLGRGEVAQGIDVRIHDGPVEGNHFSAPGGY